MSVSPARNQLRHLRVNRLGGGTVIMLREMARLACHPSQNSRTQFVLLPC